MAYLRDKQAFIMKEEAVVGTPIAIAAADFDMEVFEPEYTPMIEMDGSLRPASGSHATYIKDVSGAKGGQIKFKMKLGPSTAGGTTPKWGKIMRTCGMNEQDYGITGTAWSPLATADEVTASLELLRISRSGTPTGIIQKIAGAMGSPVLSCAGIGKPLECEVTYTGKYVASTDLDNAALTTLNVLTAPDTVKPYTLSAVTFTIGGASKAISSFKLDFGNKVELEIDPADANGGDYRCAAITARAPKFSCNPLTQAVATYDPVAVQIAQTTATIILTLSAAGSIPLVITMPVAQVMDAKTAAREGLEAWEMNYILKSNGLPASKTVSTLDWEETFEILHGAKA